MNETVVDARGQACPKPLIMTKTALTQLAVGQEMTVIIDNETSKQNVERFLKDNGAISSCAENAGVFTLTVKKQHAGLSHPNAQSYCSPDRGGHVVLFRNDKMGVGPDELGGILIKAFINTIKDVSPLPSAMVFYNNGINLTVEGSPVLEPLQALEARGIALLVCGTCLDYFRKKDLLRVGIVSNMFTILETLSNAQHVIEP